MPIKTDLGHGAEMRTIVMEKEVMQKKVSICFFTFLKSISLYYLAEVLQNIWIVSISKELMSHFYLYLDAEIRKIEDLVERFEYIIKG